MSKLNKGQKAMFIALIVSSVLMFSSMFTLSYRILGIGLFQFAVVVFSSAYMNVKGRVTVADFVGYNSSTSEKHLKDKKYFRAAIYGAVTPMLLIGVITLLVLLFVAIFFLH